MSESRQNPGDAVPQRVLAEQVRLVYQHTPIGVVAGLCGVLLVCIVLFDQVDRYTLLTWIGAMVAILLVRYRGALRYRRAEKKEAATAAWARAAVFAGAATGLGWGLGGAVFASQVSPLYQGALMLLVLGMVVSTIPLLGAIPRVYFAHAVGAALPIVVWCLQQGGTVYLVTAAVIFVFIVVAWLSSVRYSRSVVAMLRTQDELDELTVAKTALQNSYEQLSAVESRVRASEERFRGIFEGGLVGMAVLSHDGYIQRINHAYCGFLGFEGDELIGRHFSTVVHPDATADVERQLRRMVRGECLVHQHEHRYQHKLGHELYGLAALHAITGSDNAVTGIAVQIQDITDERRLKARLAFQASHDELTGLANRREFQARLQNVIDSARIHGFQHALCYIDLDQFKLINDTLGHVAGDAMLKQVAEAMSDCLRTRDTLARLGGDEFGVILENCYISDAAEIATKLITRLSANDFIWCGRSFHIRGSIGVVPVLRESGTIVEVMKQADLACYTAKDLGGSRIYVYPSDVDNSHDYPDILRVTEWLDAFREDRFRLYAQPIVPLRKDAEGSLWYEVLLRIVTHGDSVVSPKLLIPAAERYGQMVAIDRWIIRTAIARHREMFGDRQDVRFSINLSGGTLASNDLQEYVMDALREFNVSPDRLCFEINEAAVLRDVHKATDLMNRLKAEGIRFAMDDFGSGLSSFKYLKVLPVDYLKIDGGLVHEMWQDSAEHAMVSAIKQLAESLGIKTVAEWVHDARIVDQLEATGIDYAQGYHFGKPMPIETLATRQAGSRSSHQTAAM